MASINERVNKDGKVTSVQVKWRHQGKQHAVKFDERHKAEMFKAVLELYDGDGDRATAHLVERDGEGPNMTELAATHLARLTDIAIHTRHTYERMVVNHITPKLGDVRVAKLTEETVADWVLWMREKGRSPKTISNVHGLLFSMVKTAVYKKYRPDNPCEHTRLPKSEHIEDTTTFLTRSEVAGLLQHLDEHFRPFVLFMVGTGLRFSEAAALTPADFNDDGHGGYTVRVTKAWKRDDVNGRHIGPPKTARGRRTVAMTKDLAQLVAPLVRETRPGGRVFRMKRGGDFTVQAFRNKVWLKTVRAAQEHGLRKQPRVHDLRHTYASWQIAQGVNIYELSQMMGHESINTTTKVYGHLMPDALRNSAAAMERAMEGLIPRAELALPLGPEHA